jgi:hypothetical protein
VLESSASFHKNAKMLGTYDGVKIKLKADIGAGNVSYVITMRLESKHNCHRLYPVGLNQEDIRDVSINHYPIVSIFSKPHTDKLYFEMTYKSKNINTEKLHIPSELKKIISPTALQKLQSHFQN